jgi:Asp/Glu/hydantoin racemase
VTDTANEANTKVPGVQKSRGPIGLLILDDPYAPLLVADSPFVATRVVEGCTPDRLIFEADEGIEAQMVAAAQALEADGARAITGHCGFMVRHQAAVRNAVHVPVFLSSLLLAPMLLACIGNTSKLGIITASRTSLTDALLREAGVLDPERVVMGDLSDKPALKSAFLDCTEVPDPLMIEQETLEVSRELLASHPDVGLLLLECTALPDFAAKIQKEVQVPVFDIVSLVDLFVQGFAPATGRPLT